MILHLHVVRHGQTYFNRYNRLQGWSNSPLTQSGLDDAEHAGTYLAMFNSQRHIVQIQLALKLRRNASLTLTSMQAINGLN